MMLTVHGLPLKTKFQDVKALIKQECNIPDFILDNLVDDGYDSKKVRIGVTNESDGYRLMKCLEGFRMSGSHVLRIVPISPQSQSTFERRPSYSNQPRNDYPNQTPSYTNQNDYRPNTVNPASHVSPHGGRNMGEARHNDRGMMDSRPSVTHITNHPQDSRDHYDSSQRQNQDTRSDFRDLNRGPLVPPTLRPALLNSRNHASDSRNMPSDNMRGPERPVIRGQDGIKGPDMPGIRGQDGIRGPEAPGMRGSDRQGMRAPDGSMRADVGMRGDPSYPKSDHRQVSNTDTNRHPQWSTGGNDQWANTGRPMQNQNIGYNFPQAQGNVGYGQQPISAPQGAFPARGPQPFQEQPKPALIPERPSRSHVLRSVEIVDAPIQPRAQPSYPQMQKPITIMKDNFQGPTQYNITGVPSTPYQAQVSPQPWSQQQDTQSKPYDKRYDDRHLDKPLPKAQDYDKRRFSPPRGRPASPGRRSPPRNIQSTNRPQPYSDRRVSPSRPFRLSPNRHAPSRFSPTRRDISPPKLSPRRNSPGRRSPRRGSPRRISPFSRKISPPRHISPSKDPGRRISPFGRKLSPSGTRRLSPFGRKVSPTGQRRISPFGRKVSPPGPRRISPFGRKVSPPGPRRISPFGRKISPGRRSPKRDELRRTSPSMMKHDYYVEGDRRMGARDSPPRRYSPKRSPPRGPGRYSPTRTNYVNDDKDGKGMQNRPTYEAKQAQKYTGAGFRPNETQYPASVLRNEHKISPWQSEKIGYPPKDEARANPLEEARKKLSPRRSRSRSPVKDRFRRHSPSPRSPRRSWALEKRRSPDILPPPPPLWPGQEEEKPKHPIWERNVPERFDDKHRNEDKYRNDDKFSTRTPRFSPRRDTAQYTDKSGDYGEGQYRKSPRDEKKLFPEVDKDFNDIYQRAVEFRRKTEELRKSNEHRTRYDDENHSRDKSPLQEKTKPTWVPAKPQSKVAEKDRNQLRLDTAIKLKRDKASEEIALRILEPHNFTGEQKMRVMDELKFSVFNIMLDMFKDNDVSYIELVIKFRARYDSKDEEKILNDVLASMPNHYKNSLKRKTDGIKEVPAKMSRPTPAYSNTVVPRAKLADSVNKYNSHGSARLKLDSRKRTLDERDDRRDIKKGSSWNRKIIRTEDRPRTIRSQRISSPTNNEIKYQTQYLNEYEKMYDNQPEPPKVYEAKPVAYVGNKLKIIDSQPTFFEHKPKVPRIQENKPKDQDVKVQEPQVAETLPAEKAQSTAVCKRSKRLNILSPLMNSMVEEELKNVMIKVWQTLPDDPPKGAEKLVLDKLKNEAGDDLRNTIGLTITKRLLNVHTNRNQDGLLIKLQMQSSISSRDLYEFCKKYHISNIKYIQKRTYAGRTQSWTDLDELYSVKNLKCGNSKVTITPIYNFLKCPPKLRTVFDGTQDYASKEIEKEAARKINKPEGKTIITADKVLAENAKKIEAKKEIISKEKASDNKADVKTESKKTDTKESLKKVAPKAEDKKPSNSQRTPTTNPQNETLKQNSTNTDTKNANSAESAASKPAILTNIKKDIKPDIKVDQSETPNKATLTSTSKKETVAPKTEETKTNPVKTEPTKTPAAQPAKQAVKPVQTKDSVMKEVGKGEEIKQASKTVAKATTSPTTAVKEPTKTVAKEPVKTVAKEPVKTVAKEPVKTVAKEPANTVAKAPAKTVAKVPAKTVAKEPAKTVAKDPAKIVVKEPAKPVAVKPITKSTKPIAKEAKPVSSKPVKKETVTPNPSAKKTISKTSPVLPKPAFKTPIKTTKVDAKAKNNEDDFEELDDQSILALLSGGGIVLDECSGSDEE